MRTSHSRMAKRPGAASMAASAASPVATIAGS
jgi:hypothetical protein